MAADSCEGGSHIRSVAEMIEAFDARIDGEAALLEATFSGACDDGTPGGRLRRAQVVFHCDVSADHNGREGTGDPRLDASGHWHVPDLSFAEGRRPQNPASCEDMVLEWRTPAACPLCRPGDWVPVTDAVCTKKGRPVVFLSKVPCRGGAPRPSVYYESCVTGTMIVTGMVVAITLVAGILCCLSCYVVLLRRRYAPYMKLEEAGSDSSAPAKVVGAPASAF